MSKELEERKPDLTFYYSHKAALNYEVLAKCSSATEYISTNIPIYANSDLTGQIGYQTQIHIKDAKITSFTCYVLFSTFNGSLTFYNIDPANTSFTDPLFLDTIISGSGDLLGSTGIVATVVLNDLRTVYVYFDKK
jgi:hypothetical protein